METMSELAGRYIIEGRRFEHAGRVSNEIKKSLIALGIPEKTINKVSVVIFEAEVNIISYAETGVINFQVLPDSIIIEARDKGQGIPDIALALKEGYSTADDKVCEMGFGAGMGLANIGKFSDFFEIKSEMGKGTFLKSVITIDDQK